MDKIMPHKITLGWAIGATVVVLVVYHLAFHKKG
jgi:hypothetical protein